MIEKIDKCYVCSQWFDAKVLKPVRVPSQGGDVEKPVCEGCIHAVEERSRPGTKGNTGRING